MYLVAFESVQQCHAHNSGLDAGMVRQRGETKTLHLDVHYAGLVHLREILHLVVLREVAERAVQPALFLVEVVRAHGLADHGVVGVVTMRQSFQIPSKLSVELGWSARWFAQHRLQRHVQLGFLTSSVDYSFVY